ncbi:MAG: hypothetical protein WKF78_07410 [Candidatus Limnocylindrales bacterium]
MLSLQGSERPVPGELLVDGEDGVVEVDIGPGQPETLADAQLGVRQEREQRPVGPRLVEDRRKVPPVESQGLVSCV